MQTWWLFLLGACYQISENRALLLTISVRKVLRLLKSFCRALDVLALRSSSSVDRQILSSSASVLPLFCSAPSFSSYSSLVDPIFAFLIPNIVPSQRYQCTPSWGVLITLWWMVLIALVVFCKFQYCALGSITFKCKVAILFKQAVYLVPQSKF